jgi:hypothetical protein
MAAAKVGGVPLWRLLIHDWTKFLPSEYCVYRRRFSGKPYSREDWAKAKRLHYSRHPHHYQYWIKDGIPSPMPDVFVREMIIDWMAAQRGYHGDWNIQGYLDSEHHKIRLHAETLTKLIPILRSHGLKWPTETK